MEHGSSWSKWDLHIHTPASLVHNYNASDAWEKFLSDLESLPPEMQAIGINDYIFLDGYRRVIEEKAKGRLKNLKLILPVIELRVDKFGGSKSNLSRVNFHVIFSEKLDPKLIEDQFIGALRASYLLSSEYDEVGIRWDGLLTKSSLADLGRKIIESVPLDQKKNYGSDILEGFNNLSLSLDSIKNALRSHYLEGQFLTAIGKTEWADIKWNDQSIADKKTIINSADIVFIAAESAAGANAARLSLTQSNVNSRLLDCSDAHHFANSKEKERIGNAFSWIKAELSLPGLRQAMYEYEYRVHLGENAPHGPTRRIAQIRLNFKEETRLITDDTNTTFCFAGNYSIPLSPYLTCIIGGRGTGKSTLLNLLFEKLSPGGSEFFKKSTLQPGGVSQIQGAVEIDGITSEVEILRQDEIEQIATDELRLTEAIMLRLHKLDLSGSLERLTNNLNSSRVAIENQAARILLQQKTQTQLLTLRKELRTNRAVVESLQDPEYSRISSGLGSINQELTTFRFSRLRFEGIVEELDEVATKHTANSVAIRNTVDRQFELLLQQLRQFVLAAKNDLAMAVAASNELDLQQSLDKHRQELQAFLTSRELSPENLSDVGRANESIARIESEIESLSEEGRTLDAQIQEFEVDQADSEKYLAHIKLLLAPVNRTLSNLSTQVKPIELRCEIDQERMRSELVDFVARQLDETFRSDFLTNTLEGIDFRYLDDREGIIDRLSSTSSKTGKSLLNYFRDDTQFQLLRLQVQSEILNPTHFRIRVLYDGKPLAHTSFGQRCTAVIVLLLLLGNSPLVIDEPEAHLDSALIAEYLVHLIKKKKSERQIVFATHNANFVINGDAELVICLATNSDNKSEITTATIEDSQNRSRLLALEGGHRAFEMRRVRYGLSKDPNQKVVEQ